MAKAVANAAGVAEEMDLVAAAKAKALIETLDEVAYGASREFAAARDAIMVGSPAELRELTPAQRTRLQELRTARQPGGPLGKKPANTTSTAH